MNEMNMNGLRTEIAILQEDITDKTNPGSCKFLIPTISCDPTLTNQAINGTNISIHIFGQNLNTIGNLILNVPTYITYFYPEDTIPKGTKFIISFVGGNINDPHIIGLY